MVDQAKALGIRGDIEEHVGRMAFHASPWFYPPANRRFGNFIMRVQDETVTWIGCFDPADASDPE